jgi:hypothetical protein
MAPDSPGAVTIGQRLLASFAVLAAAAAVYAPRSADPDLWGHLRYGQLIVEGRGLPPADPFAYTSAGQAWFSHEYLSQVLLWLAYAAGGASGLLALKCLVGSAAVYLLWSAVRLGAPDVRVGIPVLLLTMHVLARWFLFRPQLFSFLLFALFVRELFAHLLGRRARLWLLPAALAAWVNLHGAFVAGLGAVGLALLLRLTQRYHAHTACVSRSQDAENSSSSHQKTDAPLPSLLPLCLTLAACLGATLVNPLGWRLWCYVATELTWDVNRRFIAEWQPLNWRDDTWTAGTFVALLAALAAACCAAGPRRRVGGLSCWQWLVSCVPLAFLACRSVRHVPICATWAAPVLALLAQTAYARHCRMAAGRSLWTAAAGLAAVPAVTTLLAVLAWPAPVVSTAGPVFGTHAPYGAAAFLRANGLAGRVYNPLWWGSYLTWELYPDVLVAMDGRNVTLFPAGDVNENLTFYLTEQADLDAPLRHGSDFLLVPADAPVLPRLRADARWAVLYDDGDAVLFAPAGTAVARPLVRPAVTPPADFR